MIKKSSHILICRTDNLGDVVLTLPITAWLKQKFPSIKISFLCRKYAADAARRCSSVDEVVELETFLENPPAYFATAKPDTVLIAQPDKRLAIAAFKAGISNRIGNARQKLYLLIFCNRRVRFSKRTSPLHEAQFNFEFLRPFGLQHIPELPAIVPLFKFELDVDEDIGRMLGPYKFNLILHTKSNGHGREWPIENYLALAKRLSLNADIHIWLTGTGKEGEWIEKNAPELLEQKNLSNLCGKLTLDQLISFIQAADGLVASGTGPLHLSAAMGQRTLGLFPPSRPMHPGRWAPVGARAEILCTPASKCVGCPTGEAITCECMRAIFPDSVEQVVSRWLEESRERDCGQVEISPTSNARFI